MYYINKFYIFWKQLVLLSQESCADLGLSFSICVSFIFQLAVCVKHYYFFIPFHLQFNPFDFRIQAKEEKNKLFRFACTPVGTN